MISRSRIAALLSLFVVAWTAAATNGPTWTSGEYRYDGAGNIVSIGTAAAPGTQGSRTYGYDAASRLTHARIPPATYGYEYDAYGNRIAYTIDQQRVGVPVLTSTNRHADAEYDAAGNQLSRGSTSATYDGFGMITSYRFDAVNAETFVYTANDERIGVLRGTEWTWSLRDSGGRVIRQYRSSSTTPGTPWVWLEDFAYRGSLLLGSERAPAEGGRRHYHLDHLGSPRLVTGASGAVVSEHDFLPFGEERTPIGQQSARGFAHESPHRFTGHERDYDRAAPNDSSAYVDSMHARYYAARTGRFLSVDPILPVDALRLPQLWHRYTYVGNNPMNRVDPTGKILQIAGSAEDVEKVEQIANGGLHGYKLNIDAKGVASLEKVKVKGKETNEQKAFREGLQRVIGDQATTSINVASGARGVVIGQFDMRTIDPIDMSKFGSAQPSAASALGHEVMEQYAGQVLGMTRFAAAHAWAIQQENLFTGWTRGGQTPTKWLPDGQAYSDVRYTRGDQSMDVRVIVNPRTFDVTSVTRIPLP